MGSNHSSTSAIFGRIPQGIVKFASQIFTDSVLRYEYGPRVLKRNFVVQNFAKFRGLKLSDKIQQTFFSCFCVKSFRKLTTTKNKSNSVSNWLMVITEQFKVQQQTELECYFIRPRNFEHFNTFLTELRNSPEPGETDHLPDVQVQVPCAAGYPGSVHPAHPS